MLHIILLILKIIGICLLCLIGLLLLCIGLVLFVPVRYRASGSYIEKQLKLLGGVTWLCHIISVRIFYDGEKQEDKSRVLVKIFGIAIMDTAKKKTKKAKEPKEAVLEVPKKPPHEKVAEKKEKTKSRLPEIAQKPKAEVQKNEEKKSEEKKDEAARVEHTKSKKSLLAKLTAFRQPEIAQKPKAEVQKNEEKKSEEKKDEAARVEHTKSKKSLLAKLTAFRQKMSDAFKRLCDRLETINQKKDKLMDILFSEENKKTFILLKRSIFKLIRHILPRRIEGWIHCGTDNPEKTGRMLGWLAVFYPLYAERLKIAPDFEKEIFETKFLAAGRIQAFTFVSTGIKIMLNKDLRRIISEFKHL